MSNKSIITLTTDFGEADYFVAAMKGVILSIHRQATILDLSHEIKPQDVFEGAFLIGQAYRTFPAETIHCVVVDPGVGTARRPIIVSAANQFFVAPDNGVLSLVYDDVENCGVVHATATHYFRPEVSQTFQGRDVFAPLAAWLSRGTGLSAFGEPIQDFVRFKLPRVRPDGASRIRGAVIKIDHFGNCVTNISPKHLPGFTSNQPSAFKFKIGQTIIQQICAAYSEVNGDSPFIILGSTGNFEIAVNRGSAANALKILRGAEVEVSW